jgi:hypothetical protein
MQQTQVSRATWRVDLEPGFPAAIDDLAARNGSGDTFLRAAWYRATSGEAASTLLLRQGDTILAAIPTCLVGPALVGARKVPGCYWPHRGVVLAEGLNPQQLEPLFKGRGAHALGQVWRLGPVRGDDPSPALLARAAERAGWTVLARPAGAAWVIDLAAAAASGWPRASTAKRLRRYERNLAAQGAVSWRHVRGVAWDEQVLEQLGRIEADSWIARETDGSDAKFLHPHQRRQWQRALADPVLAEMLCATILLLDDRPIAFCLDLDNGPRQYGIAGSYVESFAPWHVGKLVNYRVMADAIADGQTLLDLGSGDSGYKREMGAVAAYQLSDLLFVRNPLLARVFARVWGESFGELPAAGRPGSAGHAGRAGVWKPLAKAAGTIGVSAALATAAAELFI